MKEINDKTKVRRVPKRGIYDQETIYKILDNDSTCTIGFVHRGVPVVIPTIYGRHENKIYLHGAASSRMIKNLEEGFEMCFCMHRVTGLVLSNSAFHHSMNYESVVVFGKAKKVEGKEANLFALKVVSDQVLKGRWEEVRQPSDKELKATTVLEIEINEASAKVRNEGCNNDKEDYELDIWTGIVPIERVYQNPIDDDKMRMGIPVSPSVKNIYNNAIT